MLRFNKEHKAANISSIRSKMQQAKSWGKRIVSGILISSTLLFSGCSSTNKQSYQAVLPGINQMVEVDNVENSYKDVTYTLKSGEKVTVDIDEFFLIENGNKKTIEAINEPKNEDNIIINESGKTNMYGLVLYDDYRFIAELEKVDNSLFGPRFYLNDGTVIMVPMENAITLFNATQSSLDLLKDIALSNQDVTAVIEDSNIQFNINDFNEPYSAERNGFAWKQLTLSDDSIISIPDNMLSLTIKTK